MTATVRILATRQAAHVATERLWSVFLKNNDTTIEHNVCYGQR